MIKRVVFMTLLMSATHAAGFEQRGIVQSLTFYGVGGLGSAETVIGLNPISPAPGNCSPFGLPDTSFRIGAPPATDQAIRHFVSVNSVILDSYLRRLPVTLIYVCGPNGEVSDARF